MSEPTTQSGEATAPASAPAAASDTTSPRPPQPGQGLACRRDRRADPDRRQPDWYFVSDRLTPYTSQARVQAFVVPVAAEVSGKVLKVHVRNNDTVKPGQPCSISIRFRTNRAAAQPIRLRVGAHLGHRTNTAVGAAGRRCKRRRRAASTPSRMRPAWSRSSRKSLADLDPAGGERAAPTGRSRKARRWRRCRCRDRARGRARRQERAAISADRRSRRPSSTSTVPRPLAPGVGIVTDLQTDVGRLRRPARRRRPSSPSTTSGSAPT